MKLIVRYQQKDKIIDKEVTVRTAGRVFKNKVKKFGRADLIMIDNNEEYCLC